MCDIMCFLVKKSEKTIAEFPVGKAESRGILAEISGEKSDTFFDEFSDIFSLHHHIRDGSSFQEHE